MVYGYIRVSTDAQNVENQRMEIEGFCKNNNLMVDCWIEDVISGTKDPYSRKLGKIIMENCAEEDLIICTELSRLGRNLLMVMNTLNFFLEHKVKLWTIKDNFRLSDDITCKVLSFAFGLAAEIERQLISQRTKAALERCKRDGIHVGRQKGRKSSHYKLSGKDDFIKSELHNGRTKKSLCLELGVNFKTLQRYISENSIDLTRQTNA